VSFRKPFRAVPLKRNPVYRHHWRKPWRWRTEQSLLAIVGVSAGALLGLYVSGTLQTAAPQGPGITCGTVRIIDGDTFDCGAVRIRLQGIDAPEFAGHCRPGRVCADGDPQLSTASLVSLTSGQQVTCQRVDTDVYGRTVALCTAGERDLSCAQIEGGYAERRYAPIQC